jgi:hypothetical protein
VFLHLIGRDGQRVAQRDELLLDGYYQPTVWPEDEMVVDRHVLTLPSDLAPGRYRLEMGLYPPEAAAGDAAMLEGPDRIVLGYLTTEGVPSSSPAVPLDADFGPIRLLGYTPVCDLQTSSCTVQLYWQATDDMNVDYTAFVHLVDEVEPGHIVTQHDAMPEGGFYPTSAWSRGEIVIDEHRLDIPAGLPPGNYRLVTGLYRLDSTGSERLRVLGADSQPQGDHVVLTTLPVTAGDQAP